MLINEAKWIGEHTALLNVKRESRILNIGSGSYFFRKVVQPWIEKEIFVSLEKRGFDITHLDFKAMYGVDVVTNATDISSLDRYDVCFACNLLEHVENKKKVSTEISNIVKKGGYLIVSCPKDFPYHPSPIDNMYRPSVAELKHLFPNFKLVVGEVVVDHTFLRYLFFSPISLILLLIRLCMPFYEYNGWKATTKGILWIGKRYSTTCLILKKN